MIIVSGITDGAVSLILGLLLVMVIGIHYLLLRFLYAKVLKSVLKNQRTDSLFYWLIHMGLFVVSCILLYAILYLRYFITGEGLLS